MSLFRTGKLCLARKWAKIKVWICHQETVKTVRVQPTGIVYSVAPENACPSQCQFLNACDHGKNNRICMCYHSNRSCTSLKGLNHCQQLGGQSELGWMFLCWLKGVNIFHPRSKLLTITLLFTKLLFCFFNVKVNILRNYLSCAGNIRPLFALSRVDAHESVLRNYILGHVKLWWCVV